MTFDPTRPTRPTGPQPQPFSPAPPEPANPTTQSAWSAPTGPVPASPRRWRRRRRPRRQAEGIRRAVAQPGPRRGSRGRHRRRRVAVGRSTPRSRRRPPGTAAALRDGSFAPRASGQPGFGGRGGFGGGAGAGLSMHGQVGRRQYAHDHDRQRPDDRVTTGDSTTYHTQAPTTAADVKTGSNVQVQLQFDGNGGGAVQRELRHRPARSARPAASPSSVIEGVR